MNKISILLYFMAGLFLFNACDSTKDFSDQYDLYENTNDSINFQNYTKTKLNDTVKTFTLTDKEYAKSSVSDIKKYKNFTDAYSAKTYLAEIMNSLYIMKPGSQITVYYNYYYPLILKDSVKYTVPDSVYNPKYKNFGTVSEILSYLPSKFTGAARGKTIILTYKFKGTTGTDTTSTFVYTGSEWMNVVAFVKANYMVMGQSYANFSTVDDAKYNIPIYLKNSFLPYAKSGAKVMVQYALYSSGKTTQNIMLLCFDGTSWKIIDSVVTASSTLAYNGSCWNFIPPLKFSLVTEAGTRTYTLTDADYTLVGNDRYKNFDRRAGQSEGDVNVFLDKIGRILKTRFADIAADQVYAVTYKEYNGSGTSNVTVNVKTVADN